MLGRVVNDHLVRRVMQECGSAFHRLENPAFAFDAQRLRRDAFALGNPAHQRFGLMDVEIVQDDVPLGGRRIAGNQSLEMGQRILLGACGPPRWKDNVSRDDIEIDKPGERAMPDILELTAQDMARLHGQVRMFALERLHAGQLIRADDAFSSLGSLGGRRVEPTPLDNFLVALRIWDGCEPVAEALRLEPPFFSSRAACRGEICWMMPRAITSSAISGPVHWLMGRPAFLGFSQANAAIWQRCSIVIWGFFPGRGASCKRSLMLSVSRSIPCKPTQRSRHRRAVSTLIANSRAICALDCPCAAARMIRARCATCCSLR